MSCTSCLVTFQSPEDMRAHYKTDWHVYNAKRKLASLQPISKETWELKWQQLADKKEAEKGKAHIKPKKAVTESESEKEMRPIIVHKEWEPTDSLFDMHTCKTVEENVDYMAKNFSFFIPDREYLKNLPGLLKRLHQKISEPPHLCLFCNRAFPTAAACRNHMHDKNHTRIGTETDALMADLDPFYDFRTSVKELTLKRPDQKAAQLRLADVAEDSEEEYTESDYEEDFDEDEWEDLGSDDEVIECSDEDEFERCIEKLGLQPACILPCGDLQLPDGSIAAHRNVGYIFKQKMRPWQPPASLKQRALTAGVGGSTAVMAYNGHKMKFASKAVKKDQKRVVAVLREQRHQRSKLEVYGCAKGPKYRRFMDQNMPHFMKG